MHNYTYKKILDLQTLNLIEVESSWIISGLISYCHSWVFSADTPNMLQAVSMLLQHPQCLGLPFRPDIPGSKKCLLLATIFHAHNVCNKVSLKSGQPTPQAICISQPNFRKPSCGQFKFLEKAISPFLEGLLFEE